MGFFDSPPPVIAPALQQKMDAVARDDIAKATLLLQRSGADIKSGNAKGIITIANQILDTLAINSGTVEQSIVYKDAPVQSRKEVQVSLRAIRKVLVAAAERAASPLLQQPGVTEEKREVIGQINDDFELAKYYLGEVAKRFPVARAA